MPERAIKSVWLALDADRSGYINAGEFGQFMRRGEHVPNSTLASTLTLAPTRNPNQASTCSSPP